MKYSIVASDFELHPEGVHSAVVVGWKDMGIVETNYGKKHRAIIKFESLSATRSDGNPHLVFDFLNVAFGNKAKLSERYKQITGRLLQGDIFDPADLLGIKVELFIVQNSDETGRTFANIAKVTRCENQDVDISGLKNQIGVEFSDEGADSGEALVKPEEEQTAAPADDLGDLPF